MKKYIYDIVCENNKLHELINKKIEIIYKHTKHLNYSLRSSVEIRTKFQKDKIKILGMEIEKFFQDYENIKTYKVQKLAKKVKIL